MAFKQLPYYRPDHYLFSSQKSGRTWVRMILARLLVNLHVDPYKYEPLPSFHADFSSICKKKHPSRQNVIFLYRDPRDCVVSRYFEITRRPLHSPKSDNPNKVYNSSLSDYIRRDDQYGIVYIVEYMNEWYRGRDKFKSFHFASYESLRRNSLETMRAIVEFLDMDCSDKILCDSIEYASFDNMRQIELSGSGNLIEKYHGTFGARHKKNDPESFRTRKGKIGGFRDYLTGRDLEFVNEEIKHLDEFFEYET